MEKFTRDDIRSLLKEFGVKADGAVITHFAQNIYINSISIRLSLTDTTNYGDSAPGSPLELVVEGKIQRQM
jgi:hypothetical protein